MHRIQKSAVLPYTAAQMFQLVNDVKSYPEFLPWCRQAIILKDLDNKVTAKLVLGKGALEQSFTTRNTLTPSSAMLMELVDGPFKHLKGDWQFRDLGNDACQVSLDLEFKFSNKIIEVMFGPVFQQAANKLVDAFIKRAEQVF